jgi:hypothetical protein
MVKASLTYRACLPLTVTLVDVIGGEALFIVTSQTVYGKSYEVFVNRYGQTTCDCMDARCRTKSPHFVDLMQGNARHACKHMRAITDERIKRQYVHQSNYISWQAH